MSSAIIVHGGAGDVGPERFARLREGVRRAAAAGDEILERGGSAIDAVVAAVRVLSATMPIASIVRDPDLVEVDSLGERID